MIGIVLVAVFVVFVIYVICDYIFGEDAPDERDTSTRGIGGVPFV